MATNYYTGPGKVYLNSVGLQANGAQGAIKILLNEKTTEAGTSQFGRVGETLDDVTGEIDLTPFDNWNLLPTLFPTFLGVTTGVGTGFGAGVLVIGTRPHGSSNGAGKIWTPDGRIYNGVRAAVVGHPTLTLGNGQALYGAVKISLLGDLAKNPGDSGFILNANAITESGGADPGGAFTMADFVRGKWTAAWGTLAGFGGDGGSPMEAEDGWQLIPDIKYSPRTVQKVTRHMVLDSVSFMVKGRPVGPSQTQIAGAVLAHTAGSRFGAGTNAADLVLTGPNSKTITLKQSEIKGAGFEFGGTKLGNGEVGFVVAMTFSTGAPQPLVVFSA
jgi:hypothetical protein